MALNIPEIRAQFPGLARPAIFFDGPGGTQISRQSLERMQNYLINCNANHNGAFETSRKSDAILDEAHQAMADFYNAARPEEIVFGANMTTLTLHISRSLARMLNPGDEILVTRLDHDANIAPWLLIAEDRGCHVTWVDFDVEDGTFRLEDFAKALEKKPKIAAFGYASNSLGTINPVKKMIAMAKEAGALTYIDAVQYAPHGPIDVQDLGCDFLVSSPYKYFGPHMGALYGRYELLDELKAYKVRTSPKMPPDKFETGTQNHEGIAGVLGAMEYFEWVGEKFGGEYGPELEKLGYTGRRLTLKKAMTAIQAYEYELSKALLETLETVPNIKIFGQTDPRALEDRVATFVFRIDGMHPREVAEKLGEQDIYVWDGNYYALAISERLGVEESGGFTRVGAAHYNTIEEIKRFGEVLTEISTSN